MHIAVLGATGRTGRLLVTEALARGHRVTALARDPSRLDDLAHGSLTVARADVFAADSVLAALTGADALVSGLGNPDGGPLTALTAGADAVAAAGIAEVVWLGALGVGATKGRGGPLFSPLGALILRKEIPSKTAAEATIVAAGGTVVHAGILTGTPARRDVHLVPAAAYRPTWGFPSISRADVAALMIAEASAPAFGAETAVFSKR